PICELTWSRRAWRGRPPSPDVSAEPPGSGVICWANLRVPSRNARASGRKPRPARLRRGGQQCRAVRTTTRPGAAHGPDTPDRPALRPGFGLDVQENSFLRKATWTIRRVSGTQTLYYRAQIYRDRNQQEFAPVPAYPD